MTPQPLTLGIWLRSSVKPQDPDHVLHTQQEQPLTVLRAPRQRHEALHSGSCAACIRFVPIPSQRVPPLSCTRTAG